MASAPTPHRETLFHLVPPPRNELAQAALTHDDNRKFVSMAASNRPGLEVGFHVPLYSHGPVITRLGRDADLILPGASCGVHLEFRISASTKLLKLIDRFMERNRPTVDCVLFYGTKYFIIINEYVFDLVWVSTDGPNRADALKNLAVKGYEDSMERLKLVPQRKRSEDEDLSPASQQRTCYQATMAPVVAEKPHSRTRIGAGSYGRVYKATDWRSGGCFAVKELDINKFPGDDLERARYVVHREVLTMWRLRHENIIELYGTENFDTDKPLIYVPLYTGSLASLIKNIRTPALMTSVHEQFMPQMLSALDFLAFNGYSHRDVKPENILYDPAGEPDKYLFKLADFGLTDTYRNHQTFCGTKVFMAPEMWENQLRTPKVDIWSLFVTLVAATPTHRLNVTKDDSPQVIWREILAAAASSYFQPFRSMARRNPNDRASAAQLLKLHYNNVGRVRPQEDIPDISPDPEIPPPPENPLVLAINPPDEPAPRQQTPQPPPMPQLRSQAPHSRQNFRLGDRPHQNRSPEEARRERGRARHAGKESARVQAAIANDQRNLRLLPGRAIAPAPAPAALANVPAADALPERSGWPQPRIALGAPAPPGEVRMWQRRIPMQTPPASTPGRELVPVGLPNNMPPTPGGENSPWNVIKREEDEEAERQRVRAGIPSPEPTPARECTMMDIDTPPEGYPFR